MPVCPLYSLWCRQDLHSVARKVYEDLLDSLGCILIRCRDERDPLARVSCPVLNALVGRKCDVDIYCRAANSVRMFCEYINTLIDKYGGVTCAVMEISAGFCSPRYCRPTVTQTSLQLILPPPSKAPVNINVYAVLHPSGANSSKRIIVIGVDTNLVGLGGDAYFAAELPRRRHGHNVSIPISVDAHEIGEMHFIDLTGYPPIARLVLARSGDGGCYRVAKVDVNTGRYGEWSMSNGIVRGDDSGGQLKYYYTLMEFTVHECM